ncbi:MAG: hypothetical protein EAZ47_02560 [Bacteroidetes bacterium]|nr:MAG: hypothetical protein EAZ47_02560 [Bacteroidota bacterium]
MMRNNDDWRWKSMLFMNLAMSLNIIIALFWLGCFFPFFLQYDIKIDLFPGTKMNSLLKYLVLYGIPVQALNYCFIFYNRKFEKLLKKYPTYSGKYFLTYFLASLAVPFVVITIYFFRQ